MAEDSAPKISKLVIEIPGQDKPIEVTPEQAQALQKLLNNLFPLSLTPAPAPIVVKEPIFIPCWPSNPYPCWPSPTPVAPWDNWKIWCSTSSSESPIMFAKLQ